MTDKYVEPTVSSKAYTCPHCGTLAQVRHEVWTSRQHTTAGVTVRLPLWQGTVCSVCLQWIAWHETERRWPVSTIGPMAHEHMPESVRAIYNEARDVGARSPRSAGALLRLALQVLIGELSTNDNLNAAIGELVADGMPARIQKAMDLLRIIGNNAVHPGLISLDDDPQMVAALFALLNLVVEDRIAQPAQIDDLYNAMPTGAIEAIERRDGPVTNL